MMKTFSHFLTEAKEAPGTPVDVTTSGVFKTGTQDNRALVLKVGLSGDTATLTSTDGRKITIKGAGQVFGSVGLKDGDLVSSSFPSDSVSKGSDSATVSVLKTAKMLDFKSAKLGNFGIVYAGNTLFKQLTQGRWNSMTGGVKGEAKYSVGSNTQDRNFPVPGASIEFTTASGAKDTGEVVKMNGALMVLDVKDSKGKKVKVNMVYDV